MREDKIDKGKEVYPQGWSGKDIVDKRRDRQVLSSKATKTSFQRKVLTFVLVFNINAASNLE